MWDRDQEQYWDTVAAEYDSLYQSEWDALEDSQTAAALARLVSPSARVLDLGCGTGLGFSLLQTSVARPRYVGFDVSFGMLARSRAKWRDLSLVKGTNAELSMFRDGSFDVIIGLNTAISYTWDAERMIHDVHRLLRPGGRAFISVLGRYALRRLLRLNICRNEKYRTRGSRQKLTVPARTYSENELRFLLADAGFSAIRVWGQSPFGGLVELPSLWRLNLRIAAAVPNLCCTLNVEATRRT